MLFELGSPTPIWLQELSKYPLNGFSSPSIPSIVLLAKLPNTELILPFGILIKLLPTLLDNNYLLYS